MDRGLAYLAATQGGDGSWLPLWFGNQSVPDHVNPVYGTSRVLAAYRDLDQCESGPARRGVTMLLSAQNADGGWGGAQGIASSVEETAVAVDALTGWADRRDAAEAIRRGAALLADRIQAGAIDRPSPIGLYFTKLWYSERLYPILWSLEALGRVLGVIEGDSRETDSPGR